MKNIINNEYEPKYSLAHLTLLGCSTPELVYVAARAGYDAISPRLLSMGVAGEFATSLLDKDMLDATYNALRTTGLGVHDIELLRITDDCDISSYKNVLEAGAKLGAKNLITSVWTKEKDNRSYIIDTFSELCDLAKQYGFFVSLEYPSFSRLKDLASVVDILKASQRDNAGILIDTLYTHMSRTKIDDLKKLPSEYFKFIHTCDVGYGIPDTKDEMVEIARSARLYPGEGCIDFKSIIEALPNVNYSIELPNEYKVQELGYEEHARRALLASKKKFGEIRSQRILNK